MCKLDLKNKVKEYFDKCLSSSARDIYFKLGRNYPFPNICDTLDELEKEGYLTKRIVGATKYVKAHYEYTKVSKKFSLKDTFYKLWRR